MRRLLPALALVLLATPAAADAAIDEVRTAWAACSAVLDAKSEGWVGWHRNFDGGYADFFEFHDGGDDGTTPSVLKQSWLIDGIATQTDTSCYRPNGTLAFVFSEMTSPNMAIGFEAPAITREGRIYFGPDGKVLQVLTRISEAGKEVATIDDDKHQLARGCDLTAPHLTTAYVRLHLESELGDIEGKHPAFTAVPLIWCTPR